MKFSSKFPTITSTVTRPDENQLVKITYELLFLLIITVLFKRFKLSIWTSELKVIWSGSRNYSLHNLISRVWLHVCVAKKNQLDLDYLTYVAWWMCRVRAVGWFVSWESVAIVIHLACSPKDHWNNLFLLSY